MLATLPPLIWISLLGTPLLISLGQVLFKITSATVDGLSPRELLSLAVNPTFLAAMMLYGFGTLVWIYVLRSVPLTIAYSFMGLTFCFVPLLAHLFFGEPITMRYLVGTGLIFAGLLAINGL
jgi:undecaprenyl phosphate-alpha-L-ara4N flippase subunit ArnE